MSHIAYRAALVISVLGSLVVLWRHGNRTVSCGSHRIASTASCSDEGQVLQRVTRKCHMVLRHPSIRETRWASRARAHWDGSIHQLVESGRSPAVTTGKRDIRVCLDAMSSEDALFFVCLHELSHVAVSSYGHTPEFWECFEAFLRAAMEMGLYTHDHRGHVCGSPLGRFPGETRAQK